MSSKRVRIGAFTAALAFFAMGCSPSDKGSNMGLSDLQRVHSSSQLEGNVGHNVELDGVASNLKMGPAVVLDDQCPVYVEGHETWPSAVEKTRVQVKGTIVKHPGLHDPRAGGVQDDYYTLRALSDAMTRH